MSPADSYLTFRRVPAILDRASLEQFAATLSSLVAPKLEFHCLITTDAELRRLNQQFLAHDYPTDVLSFPESNDIAISYPRAARQAKQWGHTPGEEIRILMLHGVLHLLGHDHETDNGRMSRAETRWRAKLGLPNGLIERASQPGMQ